MRTLFSLALFVVAAMNAFADPVTKHFSHPDRVRYDGQCLSIEGKPVFIFSGSFHYFRCPKPLWRERFAKIKAAGCNAVETYVPWNWHEQNMPSSPDDFSQVNLGDLKDWLHMAHDEFGLYTIIRPGPYICAEWDDGGFPRWLSTKMPTRFRRADGQKMTPQSLWLRSDDPVFIAWSQHWMEAVCPTIAAEQITRKAPGHGGVILVQIENEYDLYKEVPEQERAPHLRALYSAAVESGIEVPIFTCWTKACQDSADPDLGQVFDAFNSYPRMKIDSVAENIKKLQAAQPDAPVMISELQGGWFGKVGGLLSEDQPGLSAAQVNAHTLLAIQGGTTLLNYYMIFGGTNFGYWGAKDQTTSYDYDAPIRESGGVGPKYAAVASLGAMLQAHGEQLARSHEISCQAETGSADVTVAARRALDGTTFLFFRNHSLGTPRHGSAVVWLEKGGEIRVSYELGAFGFKVLDLPAGEKDATKGDWLPHLVAGPERPAHLPSSVRPALAWMRADPGPTDLVKAPDGALLPSLGVMDGRPVVYSSDFILGSDQLASIDSLRLNAYSGDSMVIEVNGHLVGSGTDPVTAVGSWLKEGANTVRILYAQAGLPNFGPGIQDISGLRSAILGVRRPDFQPALPLGNWKVARLLGGVAARWPAMGAGEPAGWTKVPLDTERGIPRKSALADTPTGPSTTLATWYRVEFELPEKDPKAWVPWRALVDAGGSGQLYLNGNALGRVWEAGPQREYYLPECWLRYGAGKRNVLTFELSPMGRGVSLRGVEIAPYADQAEVR